MKQERRTTIGEVSTCAHFDSQYGRTFTDFEADDPVVPEGDGWRMESCTSVGTKILWFWVRDI